MFTAYRSMLLPALFIVGISFSNPASAAAADRFAVTSIHNETQSKITILYKWGTGEWKTKTLMPGTRHWFGFRYKHANDDKSPNLFVKFDADAGSGSYTEEYKLLRHAASEESYALGYKYVFRYDGPSKKFVELYDNDK